MQISLLFFCFCSLLALSLSTLLLAQDTPVSTPPKIVILLGPPGSGKGTQAVSLTKELGIPHISTGDLFRENISKDTDLGKLAKSHMDKGKLVPDEVVLDMLFDRVSHTDCIEGYLLDGFPRTLAQAQAFDNTVQSKAKLIVLDLDVPDEVIITRLSGRLTCQDCGNIQHREFSPPRVEGICDKCGGALIQRPDDKSEVVQERLKVYHLQTEPVEEYYQSRGLLSKVDGTQSPDAVFESLIKKVK